MKAISELLKAHFFKGGFVSTTVKRQWRLEKRERMKKGGFDVGGGFCRTRRSCRFRPRSTNSMRASCNCYHSTIAHE